MIGGLQASKWGRQMRVVAMAQRSLPSTEFEFLGGEGAVIGEGDRSFTFSHCSCAFPSCSLRSHAFCVCPFFVFRLFYYSVQLSGINGVGSFSN